MGLGFTLLGLCATALLTEPETESDSQQNDHDEDGNDEKIGGRQQRLACVVFITSHLAFL